MLESPRAISRVFNNRSMYAFRMDYVMSGLYARRMLRSLRCDRGANIIPLSWADSVGRISSCAYTPLTEEGCTRLGMQSVPTKLHPTTVIVPDASARVCWHDEIQSQVIPSNLPGKPFVKISPEIAIAGPELLFIDAAANLPFHRALLLGMELCGKYSLRQSFPSAERPVYQIEPATSVDKIDAVIKSCRGARIRGTSAASELLPFLMDNAASPMESVLALMLRLPVSRGGLGLGVPKLNPEIPVEGELRRFTSAQHFYPDIYFEDAGLDLEYESEEFHPELGDWEKLDEVSRDAIVAKANDDKQRMRLIQTMGIRVFQVTCDDFKTSAAFDLLIEQLIMQHGGLSGRSRRARLNKLMGVKASLKRSILLDSLFGNREA